MNLTWGRFYRELGEYLYVVDNFKVSEYTLVVDRNEHDTVIFACEDYHKTLDELNLFCRNLYGKGEITYHKMQVVIDGVRFLFYSGGKILKGVLRGYDKRKTIIINRGGLR
ncbi:hypothetical protein VPBG_00218 [Vibrio phage helene 12B3]|uniref:hypothetical protein n=1 Tax=Vibrio phage helene 12B3 TaxID=573173 RepID=UPI0002C14219|nr:hypothetical protein VPBG_00218 [Vibrio phage helene 12B3]YP_009223087.1 hypothetical protein VPLG_00238 [Vibrio phage eugene 12A10]AGG57990.1 hypothetical protein VPBG_00218 [Vibrio phage helene 12B3]AGN51677.1 hypothetical protein VPLG_00238 [Vibrio phage eugene 12A10]